MVINDLSYCTAEVNVISALSDKPNSQDGLEAGPLKQRFDKAGSELKKYINETLVPYINQTLVPAAEENAESGAQNAKDIAQNAKDIGALEDTAAVLAEKAHTHDNKEALDSYTKTMDEVMTETKEAAKEETKSEITLDGLGGASIVPLWKNPSPSSSFAAQTLEMDLSDYSLVFVAFTTRTAYPNATTTTVGFVSESGSTNKYYFSGNQSLYRYFRAKPTGIEFGDGECAGSTGNYVLVPHTIYGFKGGV